jgi:DNA ligase-1
MIFKPMLAGTLPLKDGKYDFTGVRFPVIASPKIDGIRATIQNGTVLSRSLKTIPNEYIQKLLSLPELEGLDGELVIGQPAGDTWNRIAGVTTRTGRPDFTFYVFDKHGKGGFEERLRDAKQVVSDVNLPQVKLVHHHVCNTPEDIYAMEQVCLDMGFEGLMIRSLQGPYKQGRSTLREGYLLKLKRFVDSEAIVIGFKEQMQNGNLAYRNERGNTARSTHQSGMIPKGTLGALLVRDRYTGVEFSLGCSEEGVWENQSAYLGKVVRYKFLPIGIKMKPRLPGFLGWRDEVDLPEAA